MDAIAGDAIAGDAIAGEVLQLDICVIIASHISLKERIPHLMTCLRSLFDQTIPVTVYLSISFKTDELKADVLQRLTEFGGNKHMILKPRDAKTSQMKHISMALTDVKSTHDWIMFCDDDDTYELNRVEMFMPLLKKGTAGVFESWVGLSQQQYRYEFWTYCIRPYVLVPFFEFLDDQPDILDQSCCDIMLVEYLRRLNTLTYIFERLDIPESAPLYHYRKVDNEHSVTEHIIKAQGGIRVGNPPEITDVRFSDYIVEWNDYLYQNLHIYMHDVYLRTVVGCDFDYILQKEFHVDYKYLEFVDPIHVDTLRRYHDRVRGLCERIYQS